MKANSSPSILRALRDAGCWIDAVSPAEVRLALAVGFPYSRILFTANNIRDDEMHDVATLQLPQPEPEPGSDQQAADADHRILFNIGSMSRLRRYARAYPGSSVGAFSDRL